MKKLPLISLTGIYLILNLSVTFGQVTRETTVPNLATIVTKDTAKVEKVYVDVEESARFKNGDITTFRDWVGQHLSYPKSLANSTINGLIAVQFIVNSMGIVDNVVILRSLDPILDQEVVKTILSSPKWGPAKVGGKAVSQQFVIPIRFK